MPDGPTPPTPPPIAPAPGAPARPARARDRFARLAATPPPGPFRPRTWRSPLRGPWLTSVLGAALLIGLPVVVVTGFLSYAAYEPSLGRNNLIGDPGILDFYVFAWPTSPSWLYAATQGLHVTVGIALVPIVLAKLWSVIPRLFAWPPVRSPLHALERLSLAALVGGILFQMATGILNVQLTYPWSFSFLAAHYYGAWVFTAAFVLHVALKAPTMVRALRARSARAELRTGLRHTRPEDPVAAAAIEREPPPSGLVPAAPSAPTISRRGLLGLAFGGSAGLLVLTAGQSIGGPLRSAALLAPHGRSYGPGPNDFQVNKTAAAVGIGAAQTGGAWRLAVVGARATRELSRADLLALPQHTAVLPIACVEGWSTTQEWTGVRLRDLAALTRADDYDEVYVESLQTAGSFRRASLSAAQVRDGDALLALKVNGADLSLDHGFPARVIVPALPGVHCTKWVARLTVRRNGAPA